MDEQMKWLVELQKADSKLFEIERLRQELPQQIERFSQELETEREKARKTQEHLEELKSIRRKKERDLEMEADRIRKSQTRLFEVKTNKEYQALLKEIETAKEANSALEEEILMLMEELDEVTRSLSAMEEEFIAIEKNLTERREAAQEQLDGLESQSQQWRDQRTEIITKLEPGWIAHYEKIGKRNSGLAVVRVERGACQGCFLSIPPQLYNEIIRSGPVVQCPFCLRFIYSESNEGTSTHTGQNL